MLAKKMLGATFDSTQPAGRVFQQKTALSLPNISGAQPAEGHFFCLRTRGDHGNYIVSIDPKDFAGRIIPVNDDAAFRRLLGNDLDQLTDDAQREFSRSYRFAIRKKEYLLCWRGLLDPALFRVETSKRYPGNETEVARRLEELSGEWQTAFAEQIQTLALVTPEERETLTAVMQEPTPLAPMPTRRIQGVQEQPPQGP